MLAGVQNRYKTVKTGVKPGLKPRGRRVKQLKTDDLKKKNKGSFLFKIPVFAVLHACHAV